MFNFSRDIETFEMAPGVTRKIVGYQENLMLCEITFAPGAEALPHSHPHEQISYILKGWVKFHLGQEVATLEAGDSVVIPPEVVHSVASPGGAVLVDAFSPSRKDFLQQMGLK